MATAAHAVVFSGEIQVEGGEPIFVPHSMNAPVALRYYVPEGASVKAGDVTVRIDASQAEADLHKQRANMAQAGAKNDKEIADLELKRIDAELALATAQADRDTAAIDAAIPATLVSALDHDRYQSEIQRTEKALALKKLEAANAQAAVERRRKDDELDARKQQLLLDISQAQVEGAVSRARQSGVVVHDFDEVFGNGRRYEEGAMGYPGTQIGRVVSPGSRFNARAWVLEPDRAGLKVGQRVALQLDAFPGQRVEGDITRISDAAQKKGEWGDGRYFAVDIALSDAHGLPFKSGMSVRVDTDLGEKADPAPSKAPAAKPLDIDGEIFARESIPILPPTVSGLWQMTVTQMAPDGEVAKKGDVLVTFDASTVVKDLAAKQSALAEKQRKKEQLVLDLADREREAQLATAAAVADMEKARRKADQPKEYIAAVAYKKLVIERIRAEQRATLAANRERVAATERAAELRLADSEVSQLSANVAELKASQSALSIRATRDGIFLHKTGWSGDKIDVGTQIWLGQPVGDMPNVHTLAVRAAVPERDISRVRMGQHASVRVVGSGNRSIGGKIIDIASNVHSKSRVEAIPVVDVIVALDDTDMPLKPGQTVQVQVLPPTPESGR